jgi:hypothetical protein
MGVNHRRGQVLVTEQFLHCANVISIFEQVRGERMPKRMTTRWLVYTGFSNRLFYFVACCGLRGMRHDGMKR